MRRWVPPLLALTALLLVPWTICLATTLPSHEVAEHWDVAWAGFDVMLAAALLATALSAWHGGRFLQACAACAGTLLVVDAWFDLLTSSGREPDLRDRARGRRRAPARPDLPLDRARLRKLHS